MKHCDLPAILARAKAAVFDEVQIGTALATADIRAEIIAGMKASVAAWESDPPADMFVARLGRWVVRIANDWREVDGAARGILDWLYRAEQSRAEVPALVDEIARLRGGLALALTLLEAGALKSDIRNLYALLPPDEKGSNDGQV